MFNEVIVGVGDYEAGRDTVALARELAASGRPLTLAHVEVVGPKRVPRSEAAWPEADCRRARKWLALLGDELRVDAEPVCVKSHSVAKGLRTLAAAKDADLVVIGASRRDDYERLLIGDDTREVLENPACAVAVAPVGYASRPSRLKKIGIGYDGSPASERALAVGRRLVRDLGVSLSAFEAVPVPPQGYDPWNAQRELDEDVEEARARIAQLGDVEPQAASGDATEALARYGTSVDLLVLGSHKHGLIDKLMSGSTALQHADSAPCPLLVLAGTPHAASPH